MKKQLVKVDKFIRLSREKILYAEDDESIAFISGGVCALLLDKNDSEAGEIISDMRNKVVDRLEHRPTILNYIRGVAHPKGDLEYIFDTGIRFKLGRVSAAVHCNVGHTKCKFHDAKMLDIFDGMQAYSVSQLTGTVFEHGGVIGILMPLRGKQAADEVRESFECIANYLSESR